MSGHLGVFFHKLNKTSWLRHHDGFKKIASKNIIIEAIPKPSKYKYEGLRLYDNSDLYKYYESH